VEGSPSNPVTIGLVGCGNWGKNILRDLVALGTRVTVALPSERNRRIALEAGAVEIVDRVADLPDVDGIVVASPTGTRAGVIQTLLEREVPIYTEKPLSDDADAAARLAAAAPTTLFVMHKWRYHPGIEALGALARSGALGGIVGVRSTRIGWGNSHAEDGVWTLAPHDLSIGLEILGELPAPRNAVAERVGGVMTGLIALLGDSPWLAIDVSIASPIARREVRVIGAEAVAVLGDSYSDRITITRGDLYDPTTRQEEVVPISTEMPLLRELRAFVTHLRGGPHPRSSALEGAREVATVMTLRRLAELPVAPVALDLVG
jgi:predicted dehydrogenase